MELYLFSGFLGSGKTTTIIGLCKYLMQKGKKVGVVTNDQGKYLVDTAFLKASDIPAVDVQSGCFCSKYQDLIKQLEELKNTVDPDIVFAESIGSAANLVGTVMEPMLEGSDYRPSALCSLVDARLMLRLIRGEYLPFSDSITATFKHQLIESDLLIINKLDLISSADIETILAGIPAHYNKPYIVQSATSPKDIERTYELLLRIRSKVRPDATFDPSLHQKALEKLQWNETVHHLKNEAGIRHDVERIILDMLSGLKAEHSIIAHIKILIESPKKTVKLSITSLDSDDWRAELEHINPIEAKVTINSRVQI